MREGLVESRNRLKGEELSCQQRSGMTANTHVGVPPSHSDISRREPLRTLRLAQRWKVNRPLVVILASILLVAGAACALIAPFASMTVGLARWIH
jgi:hypothetical protein